MPWQLLSMLVDWYRYQKDKTDKLQTGGVYRLSCENCNAIYIGQT